MTRFVRICALRLAALWFVAFAAFAQSPPAQLPAYCSKPSPNPRIVTWWLPAGTTPTAAGGGWLYDCPEIVAPLAILPAPVSPDLATQIVTGAVTTNGVLTVIPPPAVTLMSAAVLQIGGNCSATAECGVGFGASGVSFTAPATVTLGAGAAGSVLIYVNATPPLAQPQLEVGTGAISGGTVTCTGCTANPMVSTAYPFNSVPLASWSATAGAWAMTGTVAAYALTAAPVLLGGTGAQVLVQSGYVEQLTTAPVQ